MTRQRGDLGLETGDNHYGPGGGGDGDGDGDEGDHDGHLGLKRRENHDRPGGGGESPPESSCQGGEVEEKEDQGADWGWHNALPHLDMAKVATYSK